MKIMSAKLFSKKWISSTDRSKQRKYRIKAPHSIRRNFCNVMLSKTLQKTVGKKTVRVRVGDLVKVRVGDFKNNTGKVSKVIVAKQGVRIEGINRVKEDGTKINVVINCSNLIITGLNDSLKNRFKEVKVVSKPEVKVVEKKVKEDKKEEKKVVSKEVKK